MAPTTTSGAAAAYSADRGAALGRWCTISATTRMPSGDPRKVGRVIRCCVVMVGAMRPLRPHEARAVTAPTRSLCSPCKQRAFAGRGAGRVHGGDRHGPGAVRGRGGAVSGRQRRRAGRQRNARPTASNRARRCRAAAPQLEQEELVVGGLAAPGAWPARVSGRWAGGEGRLAPKGGGDARRLLRLVRGAGASTWLCCAASEAPRPERVRVAARRLETLTWGTRARGPCSCAESSSAAAATGDDSASIVGRARADRERSARRSGAWPGGAARTRRRRPADGVLVDDDDVAPPPTCSTGGNTTSAPRRGDGATSLERLLARRRAARAGRPRSRRSPAACGCEPSLVRLSRLGAGGPHGGAAAAEAPRRGPPLSCHVVTPLRQHQQPERPPWSSRVLMMVLSSRTRLHPGGAEAGDGGGQALGASGSAAWYVHLHIPRVGVRAQEAVELAQRRCAAPNHAPVEATLAVAQREQRTRADDVCYKSWCGPRCGCAGTRACSRVPRDAGARARPAPCR